MDAKDKKDAKIGAVLLAAGRSRRFGTDKRRHVLPDGRSMLATTIDRYQQVFPTLRIVVSPRDIAQGPDQDRVAAPGLLESLGIVLRDTDTCIVATDADLGMGHSLAAGCAGINWTFTFVGLADMPFVRVETLTTLVNRARALAEDNILVPTFEGRRGHPVGFGQAHLPALCRLTGDQGARALFGTPRDVLLEVDDAGVLQDLDQPPPSRVAQSSLERQDP